jgi:NAD(P)-dependent dehydrogenase (short-subunit alcohol dehydrogenase family)
MKAKRNKIVIVGAGGRLGAALAREYAGEFEVVGIAVVEVYALN